MKSNFHLLFYPRKQKNYKGGPMAIYMRITVSGKRADMSAGRECDPAKWSSRAGRAIGTKEEIKSLNNYLDSLQTKVRNAHQALIDSNQTITTESLQNQFLGKSEKSRYLLPVAAEILSSYQDHPQCENKGLLLPVLSNQKMNAYLKEIADLSSIIKHLTFNLARHTFATTVTLSNGVPIETVSKMLGHTILKTTQHYAKILDIKVSGDMALLKEKYKAGAC